MTGIQTSPRLAKGALMQVNDSGQKVRSCSFQYNPDSLTRRIEPQSAQREEGGASESVRLLGPPRETITLTIEFDATDGLDTSDENTVSVGLHSALAALELFVYPTTAEEQDLVSGAASGELEIVPPEAPLTVFCWGQHRTLPVRIESMSISEEAHDENLNPLRARAELSLVVLSYRDVHPEGRAHSMFFAHHTAKESLAASARGPRST